MVDDHGYTPLHIACFGNPSMDVVLALIEASRYVAGLDKDIHGNTPLHIAVSQKDVSVDVVTKLLELFPTSLSSVNKEGMTPLHMACRHNASASGVIEALVSAYPAALKIRTKVRLGIHLNDCLCICRNAYLTHTHNMYVFGNQSNPR
jgi:ankyrin repeat protein